MESLAQTMMQDQEGPNSDSSVMAGVATLSSVMEITRPVIEGMEEIITPTHLEKMANGNTANDSRYFLLNFLPNT